MTTDPLYDVITSLRSNTKESACRTTHYGYKKVCAWTEGTGGKNLSSPDEQVAVLSTTKVNYTSVPKKGQKVVLNLDNPVDTTNTPTIKGTWTPN